MIWQTPNSVDEIAALEINITELLYEIIEQKEKRLQVLWVRAN